MGLNTRDGNKLVSGEMEDGEGGDGGWWCSWVLYY